MITPVRLKPFLLHEDGRVRSAVAEYFSYSDPNDPRLLPLVLEACKKYGTLQNRGALTYADRFAATEQTARDLLDLLTETEDEDLVFLLNEILVHVPVEVIAPLETELLKHDNVSLCTLDVVDERRAFAARSATDLWEDLRRLAQERDSAPEECADEFDHILEENLIEALGRGTYPDAETLCSMLEAPDIQGRWLEVFLVDLVGERRIREAVPVIVGKYSDQADYLVASCVTALSKINDPAAVALIRDAYPHGDWEYRSHAAEVLAKLKRPESEDAILSMLQTETNVNTRTELCFALCQLFSRRGVEAVHRQILDGYNELFVRLDEELLPVLDVLGIELPEAAQWRQERRESDRKLALLEREWDTGGDSLPGGFEDPLDAFLDAAEIGPDARLLQESSLPNDPSLVGRGGGHATAGPMPADAPLMDGLSSGRGSDDNSYASGGSYRGDGSIQRDVLKPGRNDPCPCGSGKKYKKCCGKAAARR